jgi:hypothetical protein
MALLDAIGRGAGVLPALHRRDVGKFTFSSEPPGR